MKLDKESKRKIILGILDEFYYKHHDSNIVIAKTIADELEIREKESDFQ